MDLSGLASVGADPLNSKYKPLFELVGEDVTSTTTSILESEIAKGTTKTDPPEGTKTTETEPMEGTKPEPPEGKNVFDEVAAGKVLDIWFRNVSIVLETCCTYSF